VSEVRVSIARVRLAACTAVTLALLPGCASGRSAQVEIIPALSGPPRPFSPAVRANGFLYLAGQIGTDSTGNVVAGGIQAETRQTMQNIRDVLIRAGSSMDRVVKCTVFMADMREWNAMNEVYTTFFASGKYPARSALGANGLALNARVEIECIAV
jgi:2-iminobutanoate/2-iminopropanoate deaminase